MHLDIAVGEAKVDEDGEREHVKDLASKVRDLNSRLADIRREQQFQREREAEFRALSEKTNSRAVWWSLFQLVTLGATCFWQLRHLRLFFESKKLYVLSILEIALPPRIETLMNLSFSSLFAFLFSTYRR